MAAKKKTKKKQTKSKKTARKKTLLTKKTGKKKTARKKLTTKAASPKSFPKKKAAPKSASAKTKATGKKTSTTQAGGAQKKQRRNRTQDTDQAFPRERMTARSGLESGDLQGLSSIESADSESVDELLEEGNAFEADVVKGVEDAGDDEEREVHTHEAPEDDVPEEYLDKE